MGGPEVFVPCGLDHVLHAVTHLWQAHELEAAKHQVRRRLDQHRRLLELRPRVGKPLADIIETQIPTFSLFRHLSEALRIDQNIIPMGPQFDGHATGADGLEIPTI